MVTLHWWIIGLLVVGLLFALQQWRFWKLSSRQKKAESENNNLLNRIKKIENQYDFLSKGSMGFGQRLVNSEKRLNQVLEKQMEFSDNHSDALLKKQAEKLLKGRTVKVSDDDVFTRSEEKLMALVGEKNKN